MKRFFQRLCASEDARWIAGITLTLWALLALVSAVQPKFDFCKWDNFVWGTPAYMQAHLQWLNGHIPLWNPHQQMGESLPAVGQAGIFYFPITLCVFVVHWLHLDPPHVCLLLVALHLPLAAAGCFLFLRACGARASFAALSALCSCLGGFIISISTVWIFMIMVFAWLPWIALGLLNLLEHRQGSSG